MKREITTKIRYVIDEFVPPIIRDSKWFMWPFFVMAYGKFSVDKYMNFKSRAYSMTDKEYAEFYASLGRSISRNRITDLNESSILQILISISKGSYKTVLDVGAGNGYLLQRLQQAQSWEKICGVDVVPEVKSKSEFEIHTGALPELPFKNGDFDVVTCTHVLEHVLDVPASVRELLRIARRKVVVVIPRQRYYYYTLDEHLNFYPEIEPLKKLFSPFVVDCSLQGGDWVLEVKIEELSGALQ